MQVKKYKVIAKVNGGQFVRYNVNNLRLFAAFLDRRFGGFYYFNVYRYTKDGSGEQIANFTKHRRPTSAFVKL